MNTANNTPEGRLYQLRRRVEAYRETSRRSILVAWTQRNAAQTLVEEGELVHVERLMYEIVYKKDA